MYNKDSIENQKNQVHSSSEEIVKFLKLIWQPNAVYELRSPKAGKYKTIAGYFNDPSKMAQDAAHWSDDTNTKAVYFTLNPVNPALLSRAENRSQAYAEHTTQDSDIVGRRLILIDADPTRPAGISSSEEEHDLAIAKIKQISSWLTAQGFPEGIMADSGNGGHLLLSVDMPNDKPTTELIERFLKTLQVKFGDGKINIDQTVFNPSRISKLYGTITRKGDNTTERPHRYSRVLSAPVKLEIVPRELIEKIAGQDEEVKPSFNEAPKKVNDTPTDGIAWMSNFISKHDIGVKQVKEDNGKWKHRWILSSCPFCKSEDDAVCITIGQEGEFGFKCQHNRCISKNWNDFRKHFEPDWKKENDSDKLLNTIQQQCELWHGPDFVPYATLGNGANLPVEGSAFARWIRSVALEITNRGLAQNTLDTVVATCSAISQCQGREQKVYRRVARIEDRIEVDLGNETHDAVIIDGNGWTIGKPSVRFLRSDNAAAFPTPIHGGSIDLLRPFVNLPVDQFPLFVGSILDAYKGHGSYLVSAFCGEQGTSKSTLLRIMRRLIDPCKLAELSACPRDEQDLAIDGTNNYFLPYDNVSKLPSWLSDALCRVSTGGGHKTRKLYTNNEQTILDITRPVAVNGIEDFVVAGDLISRSVIIQPDVIPEEKRRDEKALWADFSEIYPLILGTLFDALSVGLRNVRSGSLPSLPRMADSAKWIAACFPYFLNWSYDDWLIPYQESCRNAQANSLDADLTASTLMDWFKFQGGKWEGSAKDLYDTLFACVSWDKQRYFPASAKSLADKLRRILPALRSHGIDVKRSEKKVRNEREICYMYTIFKCYDAKTVAECCPVLPSEKVLSNTGQHRATNHESNNTDPPAHESSMMTLNQYAKYIDETVKGIEAERGKEFADDVRLACTKDTIKSVCNKLKRENPERLYPKLLDQTCNRQQA
jgi:hypothetical protein